MPDSSTGDFPTPPETTPSSPFVNISNDDLRGIQHNLSKLSASLNSTPESKQSRSHSRLSKISKMSDAQPKTKSDFIEPDFIDADIITATQHGATNRCVQLLESGDFNPTEVDEEGISVLHWASINNRVDLIQIYIQHGAVIDQIGGELAGTPLHWAVRQQAVQAVRVLLENGANVTILDREGLSIHHIAAQLGSWQILAMILAFTNGQNIDIPCQQNKRSPLMHAVVSQQMITIQVLLTLGASLKVQDLERNTVLHLAVQANFAGAISTVLNHCLRHKVKSNAWMKFVNAPDMLFCKPKTEK